MSAEVQFELINVNIRMILHKALANSFSQMTQLKKLSVNFNANELTNVGATGFSDFLS